MGSWFGGQQTGLETMHIADYACPATDDRICFTGLGLTILVPTGLGQQVYDKIMKECESGYKQNE